MQAILIAIFHKKFFSIMPSPRSFPATTGSFFGLTWPGKDDAAARVHEEVKAKREVVKGTGASPNSVTIADNLDALKDFIARSVQADVIYIDPPYNTGKDFVYRDNFRQRRDMRSEHFGQWHSEWLSMMLPRLILARDVLSKNGFIFVSIGESEVAHLRLMMDEVFGEDCFAGQLIWKKGGTGKNDSKYAIVEHEYVLCYAKSASNPGLDWMQIWRNTTHIRARRWRIWSHSCRFRPSSR